MNINLYFNPVDAEYLSLEALPEDSLSRRVLINTDERTIDMDMTNIVADMAIVGVRGESESKESRICSADVIRKQLYSLKQHRKSLRLVDFGNLKSGRTRKDTYAALAEVCNILLRNRVIPVILAQDNDMAVGNYTAYEQIGQIINVFNIDSEIDFADIKEGITNHNFLNYLFCNQPNYLFNYTHVAYQSYLVSHSLIDLMHRMKFETYRLGEIQNKIETTEPLVRNADMFMADVSSLRASDAPCSKNPHGLYGEEFCKIVNFAGMSDKLTSMGLYGYKAEDDIDCRTAKLLSHALWYFIEGYNWRKNDYPYKDQTNYYKFNVIMSDDGTIVFYKSKKSERWWMQVSCPDDLQQKYLRHFLVPCTYNDYNEAMQGNLPDRWLLAYSKLNL